MRVVFVQFTAPGLPPGALHYTGGLAQLIACTRAAGHQPDLVGVSDPDGEFLPARLEAARPQAVVFWLRSVNVTLARRAARTIRAAHNVPFVVAGPHAVADPKDSLSLPGVSAVCTGEPERALAALLGAMGRGEDHTLTRGVWCNSEAGVTRSEPAPLLPDLDELPFPERALFGYDRVVRLTGTAEFHVGRGCPLQCSYCLNPLLAELYRGRGTWVRRRSVAHLIAEVRRVRNDHPGLRRVTFPDCTFAGDKPGDRAWLAEFAEAWPREIALPFAARLRVQHADAANVALLVKAGCARAEIDLISGSDFLRNEVFRMAAPEAAVRGAMERLRSAGIRTRVRVLVGSPYETEVAVEQTARLARELQPDRTGVLLYHPFPGTAAADLCRDQGWTSSRPEGEFFAGRSLLDLRGMPAPEVRRLADELPGRVSGASGITRLRQALRSNRILSPADADGPDPTPLNHREDGTLFAPGEGPALQPDAAAAAGLLAGEWLTVRSGLLFTIASPVLILAGLLLLGLGVSVRKGPPALAWAPVIAGTFGLLCGAVGWFAGLLHMPAAPPRAGLAGPLAAALPLSLASLGWAVFAHVQWSMPRAWTPEALGLALGVLGLLTTGALAATASMVGRIADYFAADELAPRRRTARRLLGAALVGSPVLGAAVPVMTGAGLPPALAVLPWILVPAAALGGFLRLAWSTDRLLAGQGEPPLPEIPLPPAPRCRMCGERLTSMPGETVLRCATCDSGRVPAPSSSARVHGSVVAAPAGEGAGATLPSVRPTGVVPHVTAPVELPVLTPGRQADSMSAPTGTPTTDGGGQAVAGDDVTAAATGTAGAGPVPSSEGRAK